MYETLRVLPNSGFQRKAQNYMPCLFVLPVNRNCNNLQISNTIRTHCAGALAFVRTHKVHRQRGRDKNKNRALGLELNTLNQKRKTAKNVA